MKDLSNNFTLGQHLGQLTVWSNIQKYNKPNITKHKKKNTTKRETYNSYLEDIISCTRFVSDEKHSFNDKTVYNHHMS